MYVNSHSIHHQSEPEKFISEELLGRKKKHHKGIDPPNFPEMNSAPFQQFRRERKGYCQGQGIHTLYRFS